MACRTVSDCLWSSEASWKRRCRNSVFCSWERDEITRGQIMRGRSMEDHIHVLAAVNFSGFSSARNWDINLAVIRRMFESSLRIRWHVAYEEPNLPVSFRWRYRNFLQGVCLTCEGRPETQVLIGVPALEYPKVCVLSMPLSSKFRNLFVRILCISGARFPSSKHTQTRRSFNTIKSVIPLDTHNNKHPLRSNAGGYGSNTN